MRCARIQPEIEKKKLNEELRWMESFQNLSFSNGKELCPLSTFPRAFLRLFKTLVDAMRFKSSCKDYQEFPSVVCCN